MDKLTNDSFLYLLGLAVRGEPLVEALKAAPLWAERLNSVCWHDLLEDARRMRVLPLLFDTVRQCREVVSIPEEDFRKGQFLVRRSMFRQLERNRALHALVREADSRGITAVFFKGPLLAELYPHYALRISFDTDIWVSDQDKPRAMQMLLDMGYEQRKETSKEHVQVFYQQNPSNCVELHTRLWEDYSGKRIAVLEAMGLTDPNNLVETEACGVRLLTLDPRHHLVYQFFHMVKHFMLEGVGIRYLIDIALFFEHYREQIDLRLFWDDMEALGYTKFCHHILSVCVRDFGLSEEVFLEARPMIDVDTEILMMDISSGGEFYHKSARWQILGTMVPYFVGEKSLRKTRLGRKLDAVFLRRSDLTKEYAYAKKCVLLLPVAWIHRAYRYFLGYLFNRKIVYNASEKLDVTEYRLDLMKRIGLADEKK